MSISLPSPTATTPSGLQVIGHRGARGLVVENTLDSFDAALDHSIAGIELDVLLSADGVPVVWHDPTLLPEKLGQESAHLAGRLVQDMTAEELGAVDVGSALLAAYPRQRAAANGISSLEEVLAHLLDHPSRPWILLEIKSIAAPPGLTPPVEDITGRALDVLDALAERRGRENVHDRIVLESFDWASVAYAGERAPGLARAALLLEEGEGVDSPTAHLASPWLGPIDLGAYDDALAAVAALGVQAVAPYFAGVLHQPDPAAWVRRAHNLGLAVMPWTVNESEHMLRLADAGVDGIVTDVPDVALDTLS